MRDIKADLHNHIGPIEEIPKIGFDRIIDHTREKLGKGGILGLINFVGDNLKHLFVYETFASQPGYDRLDFENSLYIPEKDILVVKGEEVIVREKGEELHLLVLGTPKGSNLIHDRSLEDTIKEARDKQGIIILDHPYYTFGALEYYKDSPVARDKLLKMVDAIEIHNGEAVLPIPPRFKFKSNKEAQDFFSNFHSLYLRLGALSTSDGHSLFEIGSSNTFLEMPEDYKDLENSQTVNYVLRNAIIGNSGIFCEMKNSYFGALRHIIRVLKESGIKSTMSRVTPD